MREPVERGEIAEGGAFELLRDLEVKRITGRLRFEGIDTSESGEISLYGGEIAAEQASDEEGNDPVDVLLGVGAAKYWVYQSLPELAVAKGTEYEKTGSLAVHVPADLMNYCEHAGLTGRLELRHDERQAEAYYAAGELLAIELDGDATSDLQEIFSWERGRFRVVLDRSAERYREPPPIAPDKGWSDEVEPAPRSGEQTAKFLRVVEMALVDVLAKSEKARSPTRTSPPLPPEPERRPRHRSVPAAPRRPRSDEQTVRLGFRRMQEERSEERKQVDKNGSNRKVRPSGQDDEAPTREKPMDESTNTPTKKEPPPDFATMAKNTAAASGWALAVVLIGFVVLFLLATMFPATT